MATPFEQGYYLFLDEVMRNGVEVEVGEWQSQDVRTNPDMISRELTHQTFEMDIPMLKSSLDDFMGKTLSRPWAEDHFQERVSGQPLNPPPSEAYWPYARAKNAEHKEVEGQQFSHTYPERMWPKDAGYFTDDRGMYLQAQGIRYGYGDLQDVVRQLKKNPLTRQAYLPIWFPEDTGAVSGQRVPCTLGYHFLIRPQRADIVYYIRSCDLLRHFTDDVYMAARLLQWVLDQLEIELARSMKLIMHISSLHIFRGDYDIVRHKLREWNLREEDDDGIYGTAF